MTLRQAGYLRPGLAEFFGLVTESIGQFFSLSPRLHNIPVAAQVGRTGWV